MNFLSLRLIDNQIERWLFSLLLLIAVYTMPIWLFTILCLVGIALFTSYYEAPLLWCILELSFGVPVDYWSPMIFIGTISMTLVVLIAEEIKQRAFIV